MYARLNLIAGVWMMTWGVFALIRKDMLFVGLDFAMGAFNLAVYVKRNQW